MYKYMNAPKNGSGLGASRFDCVFFALICAPRQSSPSCILYFVACKNTRKEKHSQFPSSNSSLAAAACRKKESPEKNAADLDFRLRISLSRERNVALVCCQARSISATSSNCSGKQSQSTLYGNQARDHARDPPPGTRPATTHTHSHTRTSSPSMLTTP